MSAGRQTRDRQTPAVPAARLTVFISHSTKDREAGEPRPHDPEAALAYDLRAHARTVRAAIVGALERGGHTVWLDAESLRAGDLWRATIHRWLGSCDVAVILLDSESVKSKWLVKEATILTWRASLGSRVRVVPVFLGDFRASDVAGTALELGEAHAVREERGESAAAIAARVVANLGGAAPSGRDSLLAEWVEDVAETVRQAGEIYLGRAAEELGVTPDERANLPELDVTVAHQLLHLPLETTVEALRKLKASPKLDRESFGRLVELVLPSWVDPGAAGNLRRLLYDATPATRLIVNARFTSTGRDYVARAHCWQGLDPGDFFDFSRAVGELPAADLYAAFQNSLREKLDAETVEDLSAWADKYGGGTYVLITEEVLSAELLAAIDRDYPKLRVVLLSGPVPDEVQALAPSATLVRPELSRELENSVRVDRLELQKLLPSAQRS